MNTPANNYYRAIDNLDNILLGGIQLYASQRTEADGDLLEQYVRLLENGAHRLVVVVAADLAAVQDYCAVLKGHQRRDDRLARFLDVF